MTQGRCWNCGLRGELTHSKTCPLCSWSDGISAWENPAVRMPRRRKKKAKRQASPATPQTSPATTPAAPEPTRGRPPRRKVLRKEALKIMPAHPCELEGCGKTIPAGESHSRRYCSPECSGEASSLSARKASRKRRARKKLGIKRKPSLCKWRDCSKVIPSTGRANREYCSRGCARKQWKWTEIHA